MTYRGALSHANSRADSRAERRHRELTGLTRARLNLLCAIKAYELAFYGYGPSFDWIATFCAEKISHASPFVLHELRRAGYVMRGEGVVLLGYVLTEKGEGKLAELLEETERRSGAAE